MKVWSLTKEEVLQELKTTGLGLSDEEARKRLLDIGENVLPADARLIEAHDLAVDNSALTGESEPRPRKDAPEEGDAEPFLIVI